MGKKSYIIKFEKKKINRGVKNFNLTINRFRIE